MRGDNLAQAPHTENVHFKDFLKLLDFNIVWTFLTCAPAANVVHKNMYATVFFNGFIH